MLSDPGYLGTARLGDNPDAVLVRCSMSVLGDRGAGHQYAGPVDPIFPTSDWRGQALLPLPFDSNVYFAIYGVFRRDVLRAVPIIDRWYRGRRSCST